MRSRRGLLELDLLLVPFCEAAYAELGAAEQAAYDALLAEDDVVLLDWLKGVTHPDAGVRSAVNSIRDWHRDRGAKM